MAEVEFEVELAVAPRSLSVGDMVKATVIGRDDPGQWFVGVSSERGEVRSPPTTLGECADRTASAGGRITYEVEFSTMGYSYEEHRVTVSPKRDLVGPGTKSRKFTVTAQDPIIVSLGPPNYGRFGPTGARAST